MHYPDGGRLIAVELRTNFLTIILGKISPIWDQSPRHPDVPWASSNLMNTTETQAADHV